MTRTLIVLSTIFSVSACDDAMSDPDAGKTCAEREQAFTDFVFDNRTCETDADCTSVGGTTGDFYCGCLPAIGAASGNGINKAAAGTAKDMARWWVNAGCEDGNEICDAAPGDVACNDGKCSVSWASCLAPPAADAVP